MNDPELNKEQKTLRRIMRISRLDGLGMIVFAALGGLISLILGDFSGVGLAALVALAGWTELSGYKRLKRNDVTGMKFLIQGQLFLLVVILVYCASRLGSFDNATVMDNLTPDMETVLRESGIERADILPLVAIAFYSLYGGLALGTLLYQGGMALYYRSRIPAVTLALTTSARPATQPPPPIL